MTPLTACTKVTSNHSCGLLFEYPKTEQNKAADELEFLRRNHRDTLPNMMNDYKLTRDSIRLCKKE
jgi:hypothetical protein